MKILQSFFRVQDRGGEMQAQRLADLFEGHGHHVLNLGFFRDSPHPTISSEWEIIVDEAPNARSSVRGVLGAYRALRKYRPDAVVTHSQIGAFILQPFARLCRVPSRVNVHHMPLNREFGHFISWTEAMYGMLGMYTEVVMVAETGVRSVAKFPGGYRKRVRLIHNQVEPLPIHDRSEARQRLDLDEDDYVLAYVGRRTVLKGASIAAEAMVHEPSLRLIVAGGSGDADPTIEQAVASGASIALLGQVDEYGLSDVYSAADALIFPSRGETRPLTLLEAQGFGLTMICSDLEEIRETVGDQPVYVATADPKDWAEAARGIAASGQNRRQPTQRRPSAASAVEQMADDYLSLFS